MKRTTASGLASMGLVFAMAATAGAAQAAEASRAPFGQTPDGRAVELVTLRNAKGVTLKVINLGASVQSLLVPGKDGRPVDVVLGYDTLAGYLKQPNYFGATVGRYANRIAKGRFTLDGRSYALPINNGPNSLHGGDKGFDKVVWTIVEVASGPSAHVTFRYVSPDGDQGYPGTLTATATYALDETDQVSVDYRATTDKPTIVNLSNHTYFNLAGEGAPEGALGERLTIPADAFTPIDATSIPTGEIRPVAGTAFDFRRPKPIRRDVRDGRELQLVYGRGYDHNWVLARRPTASDHLMARLEDPGSGRSLEIYSAQPGLQVYSGNFLDGTIVGKGGHMYRQGDAVVMEPQLFPDTPNHPDFGSARLDPGQTYRNRITYRIGTGTP